VQKNGLPFARDVGSSVCLLDYVDPLRVMSYVLCDYIGTICVCYLDDVIIFGKTQKVLLDRLDLILKRLHEFGLKVKPSKCVLFRT